jgi:hypothetical protein
VPQRELQRPLPAFGALRGEGRLAEQHPQAAFGDHPGDGVHGEVVAGEAGDARTDHLGAGEPRPQLDVRRREAGPARPDDVVEPLLGGEVPGEAAQRDHRRVRVTVGQAGQGDLAGGTDALGGGQNRGLGGGRDRLDGAVAHDDRGVPREPITS